MAAPRLDTVSREVLRHPQFQDKVSLGRKPDHFICEPSRPDSSSPALSLTQAPIRSLGRVSGAVSGTRSPSGKPPRAAAKGARHQSKCGGVETVSCSCFAMDGERARTASVPTSTAQSGPCFLLSSDSDNDPFSLRHLSFCRKVHRGSSSPGPSTARLGGLRHPAHPTHARIHRGPTWTIHPTVWTLRRPSRAPLATKRRTRPSWLRPPPSTSWTASSSSSPSRLLSSTLPRPTRTAE